MSDDVTPAQYLTGYLLEQIAKEPVEERIRLYRALAVAPSTDANLRRSVTARADELEAFRKREQQTLLDFKRRCL